MVKLLRHTTNEHPPYSLAYDNLCIPESEISAERRREGHNTGGLFRAALKPITVVCMYVYTLAQWEMVGSESWEMCNRINPFTTGTPFFFGKNFLILV